MPELPAFLAKPMERMMGNPATVAAVESLSADLRLVRFAHDTARKRVWMTGQEIEFRVTDGAFRHYTLMSYNQETNESEVLFYVNGKGPGSAWVEKMTAGQQVLVLGPGEQISLPPDQEWYLLLGDETSIGVCAALRGILPASARVLGAIEVAAESQASVASLLPDLTIVPRVNDAPGEALLRWLQDVKQLSGPGAVYLSGNAQSIQQLRSLLIKEHGIDRQRVKTKPYWASGKRGL